IYPDDMATVHVGLVRLLQGRYAEAREVTDAALDRASSPWGLYQLGQSQIRLGLDGDAAQSLERGSREYPGHVLFPALSGPPALPCGGAEGSGCSFGHCHHAQYALACVHGLLGDPSRAIEGLRKSADDGFPCL